MAKKPVQNPKEPVQAKNLPKESKAALKNIMADFGSSASAVAQKHADYSVTASNKYAGKQAEFEAQGDTEAAEDAAKKSTAEAARGRRATAVSKVVKNKPLTVHQAAKNRVALVEAAARDLSPKTDAAGNVVYMWTQNRNTKELDKSTPNLKKPVLEGVRLPGETLAGLGFYHQAHQETMAGSSADSDTAFTATAAASSRSRVDDETSASNELLNAHVNGATVYMHPVIVAHLKSKGIAVPASHFDKEVPVSKISAPALAEMANPSIRPQVQTHAKGIDFNQVAKTSTMDNRLKVIAAVRGQYKQNPHSAPKTWSYAENKRTATPETEDEYQARAYHLANVIRGEVSGNQMMFDFSGLRDSNEGILSNEGHTTGDSWEKSIDFNHVVDERYPDPKAMGEFNPQTKKYKGVSVYRNSKYDTAAVHHTFINQAHSEAAKMLQEKYNLHYTVPAAMVQEVDWAAQRRKAYGETDPEFKTAAAELARKQVTDARTNARKNRDQPTLF